MLELLKALLLEVMEAKKLKNDDILVQYISSNITYGEMLEHIENKSDEALNYASELFRIARDLLMRKYEGSE